MDKYHVVVRSFDDEDYYKVITKEPVGFRKATQVDRGLNINLNHNDYYSEVIEAEKVRYNDE